MTNRKFDINPENQMKIHLTLNAGGLGDIIHCIPALNHILKTYSWQKYKIWVPDYLVELFSKIYGAKMVGAFSNAPKKADGVNTGILAFSTQRHSSIHIHLTDYAFYILSDMLPASMEQREMPYYDFNTNIKQFKLPERYICVSPFFRTPLRQFPPSTLDAVNAYAKSKGYTVVLLGSDKQIFNRAKGITTNGVLNWNPSSDNTINLTNSTTILQALEIIKRSAALVTLDGGLMHLGALTKTPIIAGFTSVNPNTRLPFRAGQLDPNIAIIEPEVDCKFCQTNWCMTFKGQHEFDRCFFGDLKCVREMTGNKFTEKLKEIL